VAAGVTLDAHLEKLREEGRLPDDLDVDEVEEFSESGG
jgi:hypothetical protein